MSGEARMMLALLERLERRRPLVEAQRAGAELYGAPAFSPLQLLDPGETTLSKVIGELLDPRGSHGQGLLFLNGFLSAIGLKEVGTFEWVRVRREVATPSARRIDLVIETEGALVGIENKPWAPQAKDQLSDYMAALEKLSQAKSKSLILLSQQEAATAADRVLRLPYFDEDSSSFSSVLGSLMEHIRAPRVRDFIGDLKKYLDTHFGGSDVLDESSLYYLKAVEEEVLRDNEKLKAACMLLMAGPHLHEILINRIGNYLALKLGVSGLMVSTDISLFECLSSRFGRWTVRRQSWPVNCALTIEAQAGNFGSIFVGVRAPAPSLKEQAAGEVCPQRDKLENLRAVVSGGNRTVWWPWYQNTHEWTPDVIANLVIEAPGDVTEHKEVQRVASLLVELAQAVDAAVA